MTRRSYRQFCPVARSLDVIGERWTMLMVRNLLRGPQRYTDLRQALPGMASNLLGDRLKQMDAAGLIEQVSIDGQDRWCLTQRGRELAPVAYSVGRFGLPYLDMPTDDEPLVPEQLPEGVQVLVIHEELPSHALVADLNLDEGRISLLVDPPGPPGRRRPFMERVRAEPTTTPADGATVTLTGSLATLLWVRRGDLTGADALKQGLFRIDGDPRSVTALRRLFGFDR